AGEQGHRLGWAAVVLERAEPRIDVEQIARGVASDAIRVAEQVMAERGDPGEIGKKVSGIAGDHPIVDLHPPSFLQDPTPVARRWRVATITRINPHRVIGEGTVVDGHYSPAAVQAAPVRVTGNKSVLDAGFEVRVVIIAADREVVAKRAGA